MGFNPLDELSDQSIDAIKHGGVPSEAATVTEDEQPATKASETHRAQSEVPLPHQGHDSNVYPSAQGARDVERLFAAELEQPEAVVEQAAPNTLSPKAASIVKKWSQWSVAGGLVPLPIVDSLLISGAQIAMIRELCGHYEVPFEKKVAIAVASGLVGGAATTTVAQVATRTIVRGMPVIGTIFSLTAEPALSYATTYGIGHAFIKHFEADGTLETFNPREVGQSLSEHIEKGKQAFKKMASKR